jgi:tetratricopeptide (TPR) repeat protein
VGGPTCDGNDRLAGKDRMRLDAWQARLEYRTEDSLEILRELYARWPDDRGILVDLQNGLSHFWYAAEALQVAEAGARLYPDDLVFGLWVQIGLDHTGQADLALGATRRYLGLHRTESNAWDELGWRFLTSGRPDSAEVAFRCALGIDAAFVPSYQGLTWTAYAAGDLDEAVRRGEALLARQDLLSSGRVEILTNSFTWPGLCVFHGEAGRFGAARAQFDRAKAYLEDPVDQLRNGSSRALLELRLGRPEAVLAWVESLRRLLAESSDPAVTRLASDYNALYGALA